MVDLTVDSDGSFLPPAFALEVDGLALGPFGFGYGSDQHAGLVDLFFDWSAGTDLYLQIFGFDITGPEDVEVFLNGECIGHLSTGPDNGLTAGDVFLLPMEDLLPEDNAISFGKSPWCGGRLKETLRLRFLVRLRHNCSDPA